MEVLRTTPVEQSIEDASDSERGLRRSLGPLQLTASGRRQAPPGPAGDPGALIQVAPGATLKNICTPWSGRIART
jgi:hypothetical protein